MYTAAALAELPATELLRLLGSRVSLACRSGGCHTGVLCSADPFDGSVALLQARTRAAGAHTHTS